MYGIYSKVIVKFLYNGLSSGMNPVLDPNVDNFDVSGDDSFVFLFSMVLYFWFESEIGDLCQEGLSVTSKGH